MVKGAQFVKDGEELKYPAEYDDYFYNEHTCPTNFMPDVIGVRTDDGDTDPHGLFAYVKTEPWTAKVEEEISA